VKVDSGKMTFLLNITIRKKGNRERKGEEKKKKR